MSNASGIKSGLPVVLDVADASPHWLDKLNNNAKYRTKFPENVW